MTQESSQTPPTALYKAKHTLAPPLDPSALKEWLPATHLPPPAHLDVMLADRGGGGEERDPGPGLRVKANSIAFGTLISA